MRLAIHNDPFISLFTLKKLIKQVHGFDVSRELLRTIIKQQGFTKKKPKFFSQSSNQQEKPSAFLEQRALFAKNKFKFVSLDETSFSRHNLASKGYSLVGKPLFCKRRLPRMTTLLLLSQKMKS